MKIAFTTLMCAFVGATIAFEFNSTYFDGKMNIAIPNTNVEQEFQYIASIRFWNEHKCCGIVMSQDHVAVLPGCFYNERNELVGGLHLYTVWIPIPYKGLPGKFFTIADIDRSTVFPRDIAVLLLDKDTDPSFRKVEAPIAKGFPQPNKDAQIIGYKKSLLIENHYKAKKLCDVEIVDKAEITDELSARMNLDKELVIIKQKCETNENKMGDVLIQNGKVRGLQVSVSKNLPKYASFTNFHKYGRYMKKAKWDILERRSNTPSACSSTNNS